MSATDEAVREIELVARGHTVKTHAAAQSTEAATLNQRQASSPDARYLYSHNCCTAIQSSLSPHSRRHASVGRHAVAEGKMGVPVEGGVNE